MLSVKINTASPSGPIRSKLSSSDNTFVTQNIIDVFARKAKILGIRSIAMNDIAKELRASTKTIYKHFRTKEDLVYELIVRWENRTHRPISSYGMSLLEVLRYWINVWVENDAQFSASFWMDLKTDYPKLHKIYSDSLYAQMAAMQKQLTPYIRDDVNHDFIWSAYFLLMTSFALPKKFEKVGMSREESVYSAFDFWIHGALDIDKLKSADLKIPEIRT